MSVVGDAEEARYGFSHFHLLSNPVVLIDFVVVGFCSWGDGRPCALVVNFLGDR